MNLYVRFFLVFCLLSVFHRILSYGPLTEFLAVNLSASEVLFVGFLSDFWISWLVTLVIYIITVFFARRKVLIIGIYGIFVLLASAHQAYVDFFKFPITPFHLNYLFDPSFIGANNQSLFTLKPFIVFVFGILLAPLLLRKNTKCGFWKVAVITLLAVLFHIIHIRLKIQWYVPENLQSHPLERLYEQWLKYKPLRNLSSEESKKLFDAMPELDKNPETISSETSTFKQIILQRIAEQKKTNIIIFLLESFRPADIGVYQKNSQGKTSITPFFDHLAQKGLLFQNAYSTGTVTRSAQEAVFCGFPSGANTSLMRNLPQNSRLCFSDFAPAKNIATFWAHGGAENFDNQRSFWTRHQIKNFLTEKNFAENASRTGWGISDLELVNGFSPWLKSLQSKINIGIALTITNHIPWAIPDDSKDQVNLQNLNKMHPGFATVNYTDSAIRSLVSRLKENGEWERSLIFFTSDHGHLEQSYYASDETTDPIAKSFLLSTRVSLLISGGIAENAKSLGFASTYNQPVNHLDIFRFLTQVFDLNISQIGQDLFLPVRVRPLFSDLGDKVGFIGEKSVTDKNKLNELLDKNSLYIRKVWQDYIGRSK